MELSWIFPNRYTHFSLYAVNEQQQQQQQQKQHQNQQQQLDGWIGLLEWFNRRNKIRKETAIHSFCKLCYKPLQTMSLGKTSDWVGWVNTEENRTDKWRKTSRWDAKQSNFIMMGWVWTSGIPKIHVESFGWLSYNKYNENREKNLHTFVTSRWYPI